MKVQSAPIGRLIACGALAFSVAAGSLLFAGGSLAQTLSNHDAAVAATTKGDYVAALDFAQKAAAEGKALDPDQMDFITAKAAKQQAQRDADAKIKATQIAAQGTAQQILERQQKDYADRASRAAQRAASCAQQSAVTGAAMGAMAGAGGQAFGASPGGNGMAGSGNGFTSMTAQAPPPISAERPGGTC